MTGIDIYKKAIMLLGYSHKTYPESENEITFLRVLDIINNILIDLNLELITTLADTINADAKQLDAVCSGTAMMLSLLEGDTNKNVIFTGIYNAKRAIVLSSVGFIKDVLPVDDGGVN